jgi:hypothetical protein
MSKLKIACGLGLLFSFWTLTLILAAQEEVLPPANEIPSAVEEETSVTLPEAVPQKEARPEDVGKMIGAFFGLALGAIIVLGIIGIASFVFWLLMFIHAVSKPIENKALWIVILIFTGAIGAIVYYFVVKKKFDLQEKSKTQPPSVPPEASAPPPGTG